MARVMVGSNPPHDGTHDETPMCKYNTCTPNDPNAVCDQDMAPTDKPRRMQAVEGFPESSDHGVEHDECDECDEPPRCIPVAGVQRAAYDPPPKHYDGGGGLDPWAVWDAFGLDRDAYLANAVKYILRAGKKDIAPRLDDLKKARNYINKAIEKEEK